MLLVLLVAVPPYSPSADCASGKEQCYDGTDLLIGVILVPGTIFAVALAIWVRSRARRVQAAEPDSAEAETASNAVLIARLAVAATIAAWVWLVLTWHW
jgi:hypothetical protein